MSETAENLRLRLAEVLAASWKARTGRDTEPTLDDLLTMEQEYGLKGTYYGGQLRELLDGSGAWEQFDHYDRHGRLSSRIRGLVESEPLLKVMRESGELAERESLLHMRETRSAALWQKLSEQAITDAQRIQETQAIYSEYAEGVRDAIERCRPFYSERRALTVGDPPPLTAPRVRSRTMLQPPLMTLIFDACHGDKTQQFQPFVQDGSRGLQYRRGLNTLQMLPAAEMDGQNLQVWAAQGADGMMDKLDDMAWDVAALAVSAFYARTPGTDIDASFPLLLDDYLDWRGVDPRKRTPALRQAVDERLRLLCSDRFQLHMETDLYLSKTGGRGAVRTHIAAEGPFLVRKLRFFVGRRAQPEMSERGLPDGYVLLLGEWARAFVSERAMLGVFLKRLAEYDLRRQQWERRMGWYLVFQMNNQASKMRFRETVCGNRKNIQATPQHGLKMRTVLNGAHLNWEEMAQTNPGKVIAQWCEALDTLRRDGFLSTITCAEGEVDGSDLPVRGRLRTMLDRVYVFTPGPDLIGHLRSKRAAAERSLPRRKL